MPNSCQYFPSAIFKTKLQLYSKYKNVQNFYMYLVFLILILSFISLMVLFLLISSNSKLLFLIFSACICFLSLATSLCQYQHNLYLYTVHRHTINNNFYIHNSTNSKIYDYEFIKLYPLKLQLLNWTVNEHTFQICIRTIVHIVSSAYLQICV